MNDTNSFFDALLKSLLESFTPNINARFYQFENSNSKNFDDQEKLDQSFEAVFDDFPSSNSKYRNIISTLSNLAVSNPLTALSSLCDKFKAELIRTPEQPCELFVNSRVSLYVSNFHFTHYIHYLYLTLLTDLIQSIFMTYKTRQQIPDIVLCGYKLCQSSLSESNYDELHFSLSNNFPNLSMKNRISNYEYKKRMLSYMNSFSKTRLQKVQFGLIKSWSVIFQHVSQISMKEITFSFEQYSDYISSGNIFTLVSRVYADESFIEILLDSLKHCQKHKQITSKMLSAIALLFSFVQNIHEEVLSDFFTITWSIRHLKQSKEGAIELICVLFNRLPKIRSKSANFFTHKIYRHVDDDKKVERSARSFLWQIRGDVSNHDVSNDPHFFNSIGYQSYDSFALIFIKTFFSKSNFDVCTPLFGDILAHLASIDISAFETIILPCFLKLDVMTSKFVSMAYALKLINSESFLKNNYCKTKKEKIDEITNSFKKKILSSVDKLKLYADDSCIILTKNVRKLKKVIDDADDTVAEFLNKNNYNNFETSASNPNLGYTEKVSNPTKNDIKQIVRECESSSSLFFTKQKEVGLKKQPALSNENLNILLKLNPPDSFDLDLDTQFNKINLTTDNFPEKNLVKEEESFSCDKSAEQSDIEFSTRKILPVKDEKTLSFPSIAALIRLLPICIDLETIKSTDIIFLIIKFMCHYDDDISNAAFEVYSEIVKIDNALVAVILKILPEFLTFSTEICSQCLDLIYDAIKILVKNHLNEIDHDFFEMIEMNAFCALMCESPFSRFLAFAILKYMSATRVGNLYSILRSNISVLSNAVNCTIILMNTPPQPSMLAPAIGSIDVEYACYCRYNELWLIYISQIMTICTHMHLNDFLHGCRDILKSFLTNTRFSHFERCVIYLLYFDTFSIDFAEDISIKYDSIESKTDSNPLSETNSLKLYNDLDQYEEEVVLFYQSVLTSSDVIMKNILIYASRYLYWKILLRIIPLMLTVENEFYSIVVESLTLLIQNPDNFNNIINSIFRLLVDFLNKLHNYFTILNINSTRDVTWDSEHCELIKENEALCINYCILCSAIFKNLEDEIQEDFWPLIYRQVQVKFLIHWCQLPDRFEVIKDYSLNTLLLVIQSGPVFTDGFVFDKQILDMMVQCQLKGYRVFYSLLKFHLDFLLDEFVRNSVTREQQENQLFIESILCVLDTCEDASVLQNHIGYLILLAMLSDDSSSQKRIMDKLESLFLDTSQSNSQDFVQTLDNVVKHFNFAAEQVIEAGFDILVGCSHILVARSIIRLLASFFRKIRLLPTHSFIIPNVPTKFRKFTILSFFDSMFNVSSLLSEELFESFASLWHTLLLSNENNTMVLLYLFETGTDEMKKRIFIQLLDREPLKISKYISKRCTFSYWYFLHTQKGEKISTIKWVVPVLTRAFTDYFASSYMHAPICFNFALLFIEDCYELFDALCAVFGIETVDRKFIWTVEGNSQITNSAAIVSFLASGLSTQNPEQIISWAHEAITWSVGCNDIKIAYRALVILNSLETELPQSCITLLLKSVLYHLSTFSSKSIGEIDDSYLTLFIGECFRLLYSQINFADVASSAFRFACLFLRCNLFEKSSLKLAMPIFLTCSKHAILKTAAKNVLAEAFIPFLYDLESNDESQQILLQIVRTISSAPLLLVAASLLKEALPFLALTSITEVDQEDINKPTNESKTADTQLKLDSNENENQQNQANEQQNDSTKITQNEQNKSNEQTEQPQNNNSTKINSNETNQNEINQNEVNSNEINQNEINQNEVNSNEINQNEVSQNEFSTGNDFINDISKSNQNKSDLDDPQSIVRYIDSDSVDFSSDMNEEESEFDQPSKVNVFDPIRMARKIIDLGITSADATNTLKLYARIIQTSSSTATDSILEISSILLETFKHSVEHGCLLIIYEIAMRNISKMKGAVHFVSSMTSIIPEVIKLFSEAVQNPNYSLNNNEKSIYSKSKKQEFTNLGDLNLNYHFRTNSNVNLNLNNRPSRSLEDIRNDLSEFFDKSLEVVPITNCKQIMQLDGLIDQKCPPKIIPFSTQFDMFLALKNDDRRVFHDHESWSKFTPTASGVNFSTSQIMSPLSSSALRPIRSFVFNNSNEDQLQIDKPNMHLEELTHRPLFHRLLVTNLNENDLSLFIVDPDQFLELEE